MVIYFCRTLVEISDLGSYLSLLQFSLKFPFPALQYEGVLHSCL